MRRLLLLVPLLLCLPAHAEQEMEIIPLRHRTVDQVLPALKPFVEAGGALSGMNNQLILRASRKNREQIRQALAAIDTPQRRLLIRVSQQREAGSRQQGAELAGTLAAGGAARIVQPPGNVREGRPEGGREGGKDAGKDGGRIELRRGDSALGAKVYDTRSTREAYGSQAVQVVEGGRAYIQVGQSLPLPLRQMVLGPNGAVLTESVVYRDVGQGFYAEPRLAGDRVTLEISPQSDTPGGIYGSVNTQRVATTVAGRLGEWIELGGSEQGASSGDRANFAVGTGELRDRRSIWLLVEELP